MMKTNLNEMEALRKLGGDPIVQSSDYQVQSSHIHSSTIGEANSSMPVPETPSSGLTVKVNYVGANFDERQTRRKFTPKFPGNEIAGTIHSVGSSLPNSNYTVGDKVIIIPDEAIINTGYTEYIPIEDPSNVIQVPNSVPLEVAAMLPGGALTAYAAVSCARHHIEKLLKVKSCINVLIVGAGGLGLWTIKLAKYLLDNDCSSVRIFLADNSIDKLLTAQDHGCYDIIHWNEEDHEQYIHERTLDSCRGGVDVIIDYVGSHRSMQRSLKVLNREGVILVGGNSTSETNISLNALAAKQQSIVGIPKGNVNQLIELLNAVADKQLEVPQYKVAPVEDAMQIYEDLAECRLTGRVVFKYGSQSSEQEVDNH
uniref:Enoyl reductase (ER) domain-containing protein n=1 Tax=Arion vulgaris TaxID=1028688 RepID=A0A0B6ZCK1_9EUPU